MAGGRHGQICPAVQCRDLVNAHAHVLLLLLQSYLLLPTRIQRILHGAESFNYRCALSVDDLGDTAVREFSRGMRVHELEKGTDLKF